MDHFSDNNREYIPSTIYVSLYLFLLIFFVLLNSSAKRNADTAKLAIESINQTFSAGFLSSDGSKTDDIAKLDDKNQVLKEYFIPQIRKNINHDYVKLDLDYNNKNNFDKISLSTTSVFKENSDEIKEDFQKILTELSALINVNNQTTRLRMEITLGIKSNEPKENQKLEELRIISLYKTIVANKAKQKNFLIGLDKSNEESVTFSFFLTD